VTHCQSLLYSPTTPIYFDPPYNRRPSSSHELTSQMSIHFAPQWVKPIKPSGTSLTPTADHPPSVPTPLTKPLATPTSTSTSINSPFPALSGNVNAAVNVAANPRGSPTTNTAPNPPLSYSRVTHTPLSPNFPTDNSYFPYTEANGVADPKLAFRYSREQMLGMWEEEKVRELPIDLVQMLEDGGVLVSKNVVKPIGLREQTEVEKKVGPRFPTLG
jgi:PERQ amino acid-rich with GYF domain-containing protein